MRRLGPSRVPVAFLVASALVSLLTLKAGQLIGYADGQAALVIECAAFPVELQRQSTALVELAAPDDQTSRVAVDFLDVDGDIIQTREVQIAPHDRTTLTLLTQYAGIALQVIASSPVVAEVTLIYQDTVGAVIHEAVPCKRLTTRPPVRAG